MDEVEFLGPDVGEVSGELAHRLIGESSCCSVMSCSRVSFVGHLQGSVMVCSPVDGLVRQVVVSFTDVLGGVHHHNAAAFVCFPDDQGLVGSELFYCSPDVLTDVGCRLGKLHCVLHDGDPVLNARGKLVGGRACDSFVGPATSLF